MINGLTEEELIKKSEDQAWDKHITIQVGGGSVSVYNDDCMIGEGTILAEKIKELFNRHALDFDASEEALDRKDQIFKDEK